MEDALFAIQQASLFSTLNSPKSSSLKNRIKLYEKQKESLHLPRQTKAQYNQIQQMR